MVEQNLDQVVSKKLAKLNKIHGSYNHGHSVLGYRH